MRSNLTEDIKQSWKISKAGSFKRLRIVKDHLKTLEPGKIRIKLKCIGLNFADLFAITGLYSATPKGEFIPGLEYSGTICDINKKSSRFKIGDPVMGISRFSAYSNYVDIPEDYLIKKPESWTYQQAAAFPVQTLTALYALKHLGNFKKNQHVLIHSAAGGVGLQAMRIAKKMNGNPIGTVSSEKKKQFLLKQGFNHVFIRSGKLKHELYHFFDNKKLHLVLDAIGGKIQKDSYELLSPTGRLIVFGAAEFTPGKNRAKLFTSLINYLKRPKYDPLIMVNQNKSVMAFNLIWLWDELQLLKEMVIELEMLNMDPPYVGHSFSFGQVPEALQLLRSGNSIGKVVINIDQKDFE